MTALLLVGASLVLIFGFVVVFGAPFLPTLKPRTIDALDLLDLQEGQTLLELGSGDGRVLRAAAERGIRGIGYELNPLLVLWSTLVNWKYRRLMKVHWGNYWHHRWPVTDGIYVFLLDRYMEKLDNKITQDIKQKVKLVSYAFTIPGRKPDQERNGLFLYTYSKLPSAIEK